MDYVSRKVYLDYYDIPSYSPQQSYAAGSLYHHQLPYQAG